MLCCVVVLYDRRGKVNENGERNKKRRKERKTNSEEAKGGFSQTVLSSK